MPDYKYHFKEPEFYENTICGKNNDLIGTLRLKPSTLLWKSKGQKRFNSVSLDEFENWILSRKSKSKKVKY